MNNNENCPCKRTACKRHGDCQACREHHSSSQRKLLPTCDRLEARKKYDAYTDLEAK